MQFIPFTTYLILILKDNIEKARTPGEEMTFGNKAWEVFLE